MPPPAVVRQAAAPRVAVVTGAGSGIGRETALRLAGAGHAVAVNDLVLERAQAVAEEIREAGGEALAHAGDVTVEESVADLAEQARHWRARVDVLVNIASIAGVVGLPMRNAYSAAKAGVLMMTRTMACEWAAQGITVNAVAPGYIRTPMLQGLVKAGRVDESTLRSRIPAGDLGDAGDVASAVLFLASDAAGYITGVSLPVDGGWCAFGAAGDAFSGLGE
jgi:NAD(P)-dependent dehydrogenase (short-subunit alcohol dehydrogenase family)